MEQGDGEEEEGGDQEDGQEEDDSEVARTEIFIAVNQLVLRTGAGQAGPCGVTEDSPGESHQSSSTSLGTLGRTPVSPLTVSLSLSTASLVTARQMRGERTNTNSIVLLSCEPSSTLTAQPGPELTI